MDRFKKLIALVLAFLMLFSTMPGYAYAVDPVPVPPAAVASGTCGESLNWTLNDEGLLSITGTGAMTDYSLDGQGGTTAPWYGYRDSVRTLALASGINNIGILAFDNCPNLTEVTIPASVGTIDNAAFSDCTSLRRVTVEGNLYYIGGDCFAGCQNLQSVTFYGDISNMGGCIFAGCISLHSVTLRGGALILNSVFKNCTSLQSVTLPKGVLTIDADTFQGCASLTDIYYEGSETQWQGVTKETTAIPETATIHFNCNEPFVRMASGTCGESLNWSLDDEGLLSITGTGAMTDYEERGDAPWYERRTAIRSLSVGSGVTRIGESAFFDCNKLTKIYPLPDSVTSIGAYAFQFCSGIEAGLALPSGITSIERGAFMGCGGISGVLTIPACLEDIGFGVFADCQNLTEICVADGNTKYCAKDGILYSKDGKTLMQYPAGRAETDFSIPGDVTCIEAFAFMRCHGLTDCLTIPQGVTCIGQGAFLSSGISGSLIIPSSVCSIEHEAFWGCKNLTAVTLPKTLSAINSITFYDCASLTDIYYNGSETQWQGVTKGENAIPETATVHFLALPPAVVASGTCGESLNWSLDDERLLSITGTGTMTDYEWDRQNGRTTAPWYGYRDVVRTLTLDSGVTSIGKSAFTDCPNLTEVTFPASVGTIDNAAFSGCTSLRCVTVEGNLYYIGGDCFANCQNLQTVTFTGDIANMGGYVFAGCTSLRSVTLRGGALILNGVFMDCASLQSVTLPKGVLTIDGNTFQGCASLTDIYYEGTQAQWDAIDIADTDMLENVTVHCAPPIIDEDTPQIGLSSCTTLDGREITLTLMLKNNPGIAGLTVSLDYDEDALSVTDVEDGGLFSGFASGSNCVWDDTANVSGDGTLATVTFMVAEDTSAGDYTVKAIVRTCADAAGNDLALASVDGTVRVIDFIYGDANGDEAVDISDVVLLRRYIADYNYTTGVSSVSVGAGADANGDGTMDVKDVIRLRQYIANYDYDTHTSSVALGPM